MDMHSWLLLLHIVGFLLIGGGLLAVFVSEWRAWHVQRTGPFAEAAVYTAIFYDALVVPGALMVLVSGPLLLYSLDLGWFDAPWLTGMWSIFLFEFIEGNTITRRQFRRTLRLSQTMPPDQPVTEKERAQARTLLGQVPHFLDIPLFLVIIYCGVIRPHIWAEVILAVGIAIVAAMLLMVIVPRTVRRGGQ